MLGIRGNVNLLRAAAVLLAAVLVIAGNVAPSKLLQVMATTATPGSISTLAGGGPPSGVATTIPQQPTGLAISGSTLYVADFAHMVVWSIDLTTGFEAAVAGNGSNSSSGDGGPATYAGLDHPASVAVDSAGNLYIGTYAAIRKVATNGLISTVAGGIFAGDSGDGGPATSARLNNPVASVDAAGDLFIADRLNNRIRFVNHATGTITTIAGTGTPGFSGDGGSATLAKLNNPEDVWVNPAGTNFLIADFGNGRIREVSGGKINTVAGGGSALGDGGPAANAKLTGPQGVWIDGSGNTLIADATGERVREVDAITSDITTIAGTGAYGFNGDGISATTAELNYPYKAVTDGSGNLYVSDFYNYRLRAVNGGTIQTIAGTGQQGGCVAYGEGQPAAASKLCSPQGIAVDSAGDVFFADSVADVIREVTPAGLLKTVAGNGQTGESGDGGPATAAKLSGPSGLGLDAAGNLYVADSSNQVIRRVDHATGVITRVAGTVQSYGFSGDGGPAISAQLASPTAVAADGSGGILIADLNNQRIRRVDAAGVISTVAGGGSSVPNDVAATSAFLYQPTDVAVDLSGNFYVVDRYGVFMVTSGIIRTLFSGTAQTIPTNLAIGPGRVVFDASCQAQLLTAAGDVALAGASPGCAGASTGDGGLARSAAFRSMGALAFDSAGDLYVVDSDRIRRIEAYAAPSAPTSVSAVPDRYSADLAWSAPASDGGLPVIDYEMTPYLGGNPGSPTHVIGSPATNHGSVTALSSQHQYTFTVSASNGWATSPPSIQAGPVTPLPLTPNGTIITYAGAAGSGLATSIGQEPYALAVVGSHIFIGDFANAVIRNLDTSTGQEAVLAGNDAYGYSGDGGPATTAMIQGAYAMSHCGPDTYFADTFNYVIRKIDSIGNVSTFAGSGYPGFSGDGGPATQASFGRVFGMACRTGGGLYISDSDNGAIRIIDGAGVINTWWYGFSFNTNLVELGSNDVVAVSDGGSDHVVLRLTDSSATILAGMPGIDGCHTSGSPGTLTPLGDPRGLAYVAPNLYFVDRECGLVRKVDNRDVVTSILTNYGFPEARGLAISSDGQLLVADTGSNSLREYNLTTQVQTVLAGNGTPSLSGDGGQATSAQLGAPFALAMDAADYQYVADTQDSVIRRVSPNGVITTVAGNGTPGASGDGGPATSASLYLPRGVAVGPQGDLFISDTGNDRIRKVDRTTGVISTLSSIKSPRGLAVDASGNIYVADATDSEVWIVNSVGTVVFAGTGTAGYSGDGAMASSAELNSPEGVTVDSSGNVYIADTANNRIRRVDHATRRISTVAGNGTLGPAGDSGSARSAQLGAPWGVVTDAEGNIYIADTFNQRIRIVDSQGQIRTVVANCQLRPGWAGDGGSTTFASLNYPVGLAADQFGNIFIADLGNNRVRGVAPVVSARQSVCPSPSGTPGARGTTQSPISSPHPRVVSGRHDQGPLMSDMPTRASSHPFAVSRPAMPAPRTLPRVGAQSSGQSRQPQPAAAIPIGRAISSIGDSLNAPILKWSAPSIIVLTIVTVAFLLHQRRKKRRRHPHR